MSGPALVEENGKVAPSTKTDMASYGSRSGSAVALVTRRTSWQAQISERM